MSLERWKQRLWIIDGHNLIFSLPTTNRLQRGGEGQAARSELERILAPFARVLSRHLIIVYDGNELLPNPEAGEQRGFQILFSQPPEEEADDRIIFLAKQACDRHEPVTIVTDDRRTLSSRLPLAAQVVGIAEFRQRFLQPLAPAAPDEKSVPADTRQELENLFLSRDAEKQKSRYESARQRARAGMKRWQRIHGNRSDSPDTVDGEANYIDDDGEPIEHYRPSRAPVLGAKAYRKDEPRQPANPEKTAAGLAKLKAEEQLKRQAKEAKEARKKRGERRQQRRLAQQKSKKRSK
jgi:predicted RNA-binding protein with PIN domain